MAQAKTRCCVRWGPLSGLDVPAQEAIVALLRQWKQKGGQIVTACHEPLLIERLADQVIVLQKGTVLRRWSQEDLQQAGEPAVYPKCDGRAGTIRYRCAAC